MGLYYAFFPLNLLKNYDTGFRIVKSNPGFAVQTQVEEMY